MDMKIFKGWLASSQDATQIANKVKGLVLIYASIFTFLVAHLFHVTLSPTDVISLATDLGGVAGAVWTIYGTVLHVLAYFGSTTISVENPIVQ